MSVDGVGHQIASGFSTVEIGANSQCQILTFKEVGINEDVSHSFELRSVGNNTAGVYVARAVSRNTIGPLFHRKNPFILKLYNAEAAKGTLKNLDIELNDGLIAEYFAMMKNGELQAYMDHLCQVVETSTLPFQIANAFEQDQIPKGELAWYLIAKCSKFDGCPDVTNLCESRGLLHRQQKTPVYRLALAMLCVVLARHKEFAVQTYLRKYNTQGILPSIISELKFSTQSTFLGSLISDAVAMEMFEGITLLDAAESTEAQELFAQWSIHDLQRGLQDVVHLGSCLLPLGLQQFDCYAQNIFLHFNAKAGYTGTTWIDVESLKPVQGNTQARVELNTIVHRLLEQQHSHPGNHFRVTIDGFGPRLACAKPDLYLENDLCIALEKFYYQSCSATKIHLAARGECRMTYYDTHLYRIFPKDLLTTTVYWTLMQSACKTFADKLHLITAYLQILRYVVEFHINGRGTYCHCWLRATCRSIVKFHQALGLDQNFEWTDIVKEVLNPLARLANQIDKLRPFTSRNLNVDGRGVSRELSCRACKGFGLGPSSTSLESKYLYHDFQHFVQLATQDSTFADALNSVDADQDKVTEFLSIVSIRTAREMTLFQPLEQLGTTMSRLEFGKMVERRTRGNGVFEDWRIKVFPAF